MPVVFASPPSLFKNATGTAVGMPVINGSPAKLIGIGAAKVAGNPQDKLSNWARGLGGTAEGPPGTLNQYISELGIVTQMAGSFKDSISKPDGVSVVATVEGELHRFSVRGIAFHRTVQPGAGGTCNVRYGHGIEGLLGYFEDNRISRNPGQWTVIRIGGSVLRGVVTSLDFAMHDTKFNLWSWRLGLMIHPNIQAGQAKSSGDL
jgi:hypothetical protein